MAPSGAMVQCELCREVFHCGCVSSASELEYGQAWLCPHCQRSKKPPLDKVLPLLASLQRIRVRLPEGDALRFLIERTVRWQHKVQQACMEGVLETASKTVSAGWIVLSMKVGQLIIENVFRYSVFFFFVVVSGERRTERIFTSDSGNIWFSFSYRASVNSTAG